MMNANRLRKIDDGLLKDAFLALKISPRLSFWLVIGVAAAVRLAYFAQYYGTPFYLVPMWDADEYHTIALELSRGHIHPFLAYRPPLYPMLLGLVYMVFGAGPLVPSLLQIAAGVWSAVLAQKIGERLFGRWVGLGAGLAVGLSGMMFYNDLELMPTTLEALLMLLLVWEMVKIIESPVIPARAGIQTAPSQDATRLERTGLDSRLRGNDRTADNIGRAWLAGLWFALSALTRAVMLPLFPFLLWFLWRARVGWKALLQFALAGASPIALSLIIHIASGAGPSSVAAQGGINFYIGSRRGADGFTATFPGVGAGWNWDTVRRTAEAAVGKRLNPTEADAYYWKKGREEIAADPAAWLKLMWKKARLFWNHIEISNNRDLYYQAKRYPVFGALMWLGMSVALPLALAGIWLERRRLEVGLLTLVIVVFYAVMIPFFVNARFRHPILPLIMILAAGGVAALARMAGNWRKTRTADRLGAPAALALGLILPWSADSGINARRWDYGLFTEATALERLRRLDDAEATYRRALEVNPRAPFVNFNLGEIAGRRGDFNGAATLYKRELEIQPAYGSAWNSLGAALLAQGDEPQALACFERAYRLRPDLTEAAHKAAEILLRWSEGAIREGRMSEARRFLAQARDFTSDSPKISELKRRLDDAL